MIPRLLTCEHATNAVPDGIDLGVGPEVLASHVAWDPGARELAERLAERWRASLYAGRYTRLLVDLNRSPHRDVVIPAVAFGVPVPGNQALGEAERALRLERWHRPFRDAVLAAARDAEAQGALLHLSVHSFSPKVGDDERPYPIGILFDPARAWEARLAQELCEAVRGRGWDARLNQPYTGYGDGTTTWLRTQFPVERYAGFEIELNHGWPEDVLLRAGDDIAAAIEALGG